MERVLGKRLLGIVSVDEMQFCLMPERGTIDAVINVKRLQGEYQEKRWICVICMCVYMCGCEVVLGHYRQ